MVTARLGAVVRFIGLVIAMAMLLGAPLSAHLGPSAAWCVQLPADQRPCLAHDSESRGSIRSAPNGSGSLLSSLAYLLDWAEEEDDDEVHAGSPAAGFDNDACDQGDPVTHLSFRRPHGEPIVAPDAWGLRASAGHPRGVDEPPRA